MGRTRAVAAAVALGWKRVFNNSLMSHHVENAPPSICGYRKGCYSAPCTCRRRSSCCRCHRSRRRPGRGCGSRCCSRRGLSSSRRSCCRRNRLGSSIRHVDQRENLLDHPPSDVSGGSGACPGGFGGVMSSEICFCGLASEPPALVSEKPPQLWNGHEALPPLSCGRKDISAVGSEDQQSLGCCCRCRGGGGRGGDRDGGRANGGCVGIINCCWCSGINCCWRGCCVSVCWCWCWCWRSGGGGVCICCCCCCWRWPCWRELFATLWMS